MKDKYYYISFFDTMHYVPVEYIHDPANIEKEFTAWEMRILPSVHNIACLIGLQDRELMILVFYRYNTSYHIIRDMTISGHKLCDIPHNITPLRDTRFMAMTIPLNKDCEVRQFICHL